MNYNEVKDLGNGKLGGYLVRYSTPDTPDATGDYFDATTELNSFDTLPVLYHHGKDETMKRRIVGRATTKRDEVGLWVETQLDLRADYEKAIYEMAQAGKLGWSSGALSHLVEREPVGKAMHIKSWWIGEASLTPTPAEYRNEAITIKGETMATTETKADYKVEGMLSMEAVEAAVETAAADAVAKAMLKRDEAEKAKKDYDAAIEAARIEGAKQAMEEMKSTGALRKAPAFISGTGKSDDGVGGFKSWLATGEQNGDLIRPDGIWTKAAFNQTTGASGGFLVPDPLYNRVIAKRNNASWVRQAPVQFFQTDADHLLIPVEDTSATAFVITAEQGSYNQNEPTVAQRNLILYKLTKRIQATEEFMLNQATNFDSWIADVLGRAEALTENAYFTTGTGTSEPQGVEVGATAGNTVTTSAVLVPADFYALIGKLGSGYNVPSECAFLMQNATKWYAQGIGSSNFQPFAKSPTNNDFAGYPGIVDDELDAYTVAASSGHSLLFGNFSFYAVGEKPGMLVQRNPWLNMATGIVDIFANIYRGGLVLQSEAFYYTQGK